MKRYFAFSFLIVIFLSPFQARAEGKVEYDKGSKKRERQFISAESCVHTPCIVTQWGAIRLPPHMGKTHRIQLNFLHRGLLYPISLFQESTTLEQKLSERIFNRKPNRKVVSLGNLVETGGNDVVYIYGLLLQYEFDEGDLIALTLTSLKNPSKAEEYYFRYHQEGMKFDVDVAFVQPINIFTPNPGGIIQAAYSTVALSFSVGWPMDPEKHYSLPGKIGRAVRLNLISGLLIRKDVGSFNGDNITKEFFDGFGGVGITFLDFLALGYGGNFIKSPHTTFPFVGIEVRHLFEAIHSLKTDTHTRWKRYLREEMERGPLQ